jgi:MarR-like DNA-binding transcriptional regulator SgrR of sgrS sRNA
MMIKYNETNVHAIPNTATGAGHMAQGPAEIFSLRPGWNNFPAHVWKQHEKHPQIQKMIRAGKIELMADKVTVTVRSKSTGKTKKVVKLIGQSDEMIKLKYFDEKRAVAIVKGTLNRDMLQEWLDEESRHKVKRAIEKQIKPLLPSEEKAERDEDEVE